MLNPICYDIEDYVKTGVIKLSKEEVIVEVDIPGFNKNEIDVSIEDDYIRINALNEKRKFKPILFTINSSATRASLGTIKLDRSSASAELVNGVLTVTIKTLAKLSRVEIK